MSAAKISERATCKPVSFDNIHQIIRCSTRFPNCNIRIINLIFAKDRLDLIMIDIRKRDGVCDCNTAFFLFAHENGWRSLVQSDAEAFEFGLDELLVTKGF